MPTTLGPGARSRSTPRVLALYAETTDASRVLTGLGVDEQRARTEISRLRAAG